MGGTNSAIIERAMDKIDSRLEVRSLCSVILQIARDEPNRPLIDASFDHRFNAYSKDLARRVGQDQTDRFLREVGAYGGGRPKSSVSQYLAYLQTTNFK